MKIAIVAASSVVPMIELQEGVDKIKAEGFDVLVHPAVSQVHFTYAGTDEERAQSIYQCAMDDSVDLLWMARGGYGASRVIPLLEKMSAGKKPKKKLLIGYSDVTVLHEYVRRAWGWSTLHGNMPASASFLKPDPSHWQAMLSLIRTGTCDPIWGKVKWHSAPKTVEASLVGGNLSLWAGAVGTPWGSKPGSGDILFLEDVHEKYYRLDRMMTQLRLSGNFDSTPLLLLGDFTDCDDDSIMQVKKPGRGKQPLRPALDWPAAMREIFESLDVPLASGLPVGHGPNYAPLPLGATYRIEIDGTVRLINWDWSHPAQG